MAAEKCTDRSHDQTGKTRAKPVNKPIRSHQRYWVWAALAAIILLTSAVRIRLLAVPLERDEGEYAYAGQLILQGVAPYSLVYNMKMPGIYAAYALILAIFGQTHIGVHLGLLAINIATILLLFLLGRELFGPAVGVVTAAAFAVLSLGPGVVGTSANAEHFVILPAVGGILLLVRSVDSGKRLLLFAAAVLLGLGFLMKQHGAAFVIFGGLYLLCRELSRRPFGRRVFWYRLGIFAAGVLLPFAVTCLLLWWAGVFEKFWFWTFQYAHKYISHLSLADGLYGLKVRMPQIAGSAVSIWALAAIGMVGLFRSPRLRRQSPFALGLLLFSFLATCPGFYFRQHYFILMLPAVALLAGIGSWYLRDFFNNRPSTLFARVIPIVLVLAALFGALYQHRRILFVLSPTDVSREIYGPNPFPESLAVARYIRQHSTPRDTIAVIGSEPQIYFYTDRRSATAHIYTYPLMQGHPYALAMQTEMIDQIESARPKFLVMVNAPTSWLVKEGSEQLIFEWVERYGEQNYHIVGLIEITPTWSVYRWDQDAVDYEPKSQWYLRVLQRKAEESP